jgi:hypothetical protein
VDAAGRFGAARRGSEQAGGRAGGRSPALDVAESGATSGVISGSRVGRAGSDPGIQTGECAETTTAVADAGVGMERGKGRAEGVGDES